MLACSGFLVTSCEDPLLEDLEPECNELDSAEAGADLSFWPVEEGFPFPLNLRWIMSSDNTTNKALSLPCRLGLTTPRIVSSSVGEKETGRVLTASMKLYVRIQQSEALSEGKSQMVGLDS